MRGESTWGCAAGACWTARWSPRTTAETVVASGPVVGHSRSALVSRMLGVEFFPMADDTAGNPAVAAADMALVRRFEPILRFTEGELFLPASVDEYV